MAAAGQYTVAMQHWRERIKGWYPEYRSRPYFIPPIWMNRTRYQQVQHAGASINVTEPPVSTVPPRGARPANQPPFMLSDVRDDRAQTKVLRCLSEMPRFEREVMFIVSQLNFGDYLNEPAYAAAVQSCPRPIDLQPQEQDKGDFDFLIIHRTYGIVAGQIKAIGDDFPPTMTEKQQDQAIIRQLKKAMKQMNKDQDVLRHLTSDLPSQPRVQSVAMFPNISTAQLRRVMNTQLARNLRTCLGIAETADPLPLCWTSDTLSHPQQWWTTLTAPGPDPHMDDELYLDLLARFVGPATTIKVACTTLPFSGPVDLRTEGECVAEAAWRFTQLVLHPSQLSILNSSEKRVFLSGPPGCGKTVVLALKALEWLQQGNEVLIVSTTDYSVSVSHYLQQQLRMKAGIQIAATQLHLLLFNLFPETVSGYQQHVDKAVVDISKYGRTTGKLFIIADEVTRMFNVVCDKIAREVPEDSLHIWAATVLKDNQPTLLTEYRISEPLRCPPSVTREVQKSTHILQGALTHDYTEPPAPLPAEGRIKVIKHEASHDAVSPIDCGRCGEEVGNYLHVSLRVGQPGGALRYDDVLLLTSRNDLAEQNCDFWEVIPASGIVRGLRQVGVPVKVITHSRSRDIPRIGTRSIENKVIATHSGVVSGLERSVVVYLQNCPDGGADVQNGRLYCMSRCTSQLVWVKPTEEGNDHDDDEEMKDESGGAGHLAKKLKKY